MSYLIERLHQRHVETNRFDEACILCLDAKAKRPEWVIRLPKLARELGTRRALA